MNRHEAQQQLTALAQAMRAGGTIPLYELPLWMERTKDGVKFYLVAAARIDVVGRMRMADWLETCAIDDLLLED